MLGDRPEVIEAVELVATGLRYKPQNGTDDQAWDPPWCDSHEDKPE